MLKTLASGILDFIYPPMCAACTVRLDEDRDSGSILCGSCAQNLEECKELLIHEGKSDFPHLCGELYVDGIYSVWKFSPILEMLIHRMKYTHAPGTARFLGQQMAPRIQSVVSMREQATMMPVPLHPVRKRERGYNQSDQLARGIATRIPVGLEVGGLRRKKRTPSQTHLSSEHRRQNVQDAFIWHHNREMPDTVILVDDVVTTGATVNECARVLKQEGAKVVLGLCCLRPRLQTSGTSKMSFES